MSTATTTRNADRAISRCETFRASALSATLEVPGAGRLDGADRERFDADRDVIVYAVMSYGTPIAWLTPRGWHVVTQRFSVTTSRHQSVTLRGVREWCERSGVTCVW
jgi:hypothetical protein